MNQQTKTVNLFGVEIESLDTGLEILIDIIEEEYGQLYELEHKLKYEAIGKLHSMGAFAFRNAALQTSKRFFISKVTVYKIIRTLGWSE